VRAILVLQRVEANHYAGPEWPDRDLIAVLTTITDPREVPATDLAEAYQADLPCRRRRGSARLISGQPHCQQLRPRLRANDAVYGQGADLESLEGFDAPLSPGSEHAVFLQRLYI
jgi:hypothetical protein